jgi:asparagine synthase (glutamine-hydrolysing)
MCGIAGIWHRNSGRPVDTGLLETMTATLRHRGPDDAGILVDGPLGLAHTRLSIIDLSSAGHQPFRDPSRQVALVYNGEIYNHAELRAELEAKGRSFVSRTDTEVVLQAYLEWGHASVERLTGMFAFAIWDERDRSLFLARDRVGEKPLCYSEAGGSFRFASEIATLLVDPEVPRELDLTALGLFLGNGKFIPWPRSAYAAIRKLPPAHRMIVTAAGCRIERYWTPDFGRKTERSFGETLDELDATFDTVARSMLMSDVPLGLLLSGGTDSTLIATLLSRRGARLSTFSCGEGPGDEEFARAAQVARTLGTEHHEFSFRLQPQAYLDVLDLFGEPLFEGSIVYRLAMCRYVRESGVTVLLAGDGGDETFGGYEYYSGLLRYPAIKKTLARVLGPPAIGADPGWLATQRRRTGLHARPVADAVALGLALDYRERLEGLGCTRDEALGAAEVARASVRDLLRAAQAGDVVDATLYTDLMYRLHYNHVIVTDTVGMAHSLELRAPFLDRRIVELAARLPAAFKVSADPTRNKRILKALLERRFDPALVYARKIGYGGNIQYLDAGRPLWRRISEAVLARPRTRELGLVGAAGLDRLRHWDGPIPRLALMHRVSLLTLELWLDRVLGEGRLLDALKDEARTAPASLPA